MTAPLEDDLDRLHGAPLDEFVTKRNALARELRRAGDRDCAAEVAALPKPTLVAWTVNQLAQTRRRDVDLLLDAGRRIVDAQQASITRGGRAGLDAAQISLRKAVADLIDAAREILGPRATDSTLRRVSSTLRAAATSPSGRELLARGRLTDQLDDTGWEIVSGLEPAGDSSEACQRVRREAEAARQTLRALRRDHAEVEKRLDRARRDEERAVDELQAAKATSAALEQELVAITRKLCDAERKS